MTGNDLGEDGWHETKMRKPKHLGCGGCRSCSQPARIDQAWLASRRAWLVRLTMTALLLLLCY